MLVLLCKLWPYLAGILIGWLLCGWFARRLKYCPAPVERIVEKQVTVEKVVDNPEHVTRLASLDSGVLGGNIAPVIDLAGAKAAGIVIKSEDDFTVIEGIGPKISALIHADGINTFSKLSEVEPDRLQHILDAAGSNYTLANPGTWPDQAMLVCNNRWSALKALQEILIGGVYQSSTASSGGENVDVADSGHLATISDLEQQLETFRRGPTIDTGMAREAGFVLKGTDLNEQADFTVVEGIGPKINDLIHAAGIHSYQQLSLTTVARIQQILDEGGSHFQLAKPRTWPAQSGLAASNQWDALKAWQDVLDGGEE